MLIITHDELIRRYNKVFDYDWAKTSNIITMILRLYDSDNYRIDEYFIKLYDVNEGDYKK